MEIPTANEALEGVAMLITDPVSLPEAMKGSTAGQSPSIVVLVYANNLDVIEHPESSFVQLELELWGFNETTFKDVWIECDNSWLELYEARSLYRLLINHHTRGLVLSHLKDPYDPAWRQLLDEPA